MVTITPPGPKAQPGTLQTAKMEHKSSQAYDAKINAGREDLALAILVQAVIVTTANSQRPSTQKVLNTAEYMWRWIVGDEFIVTDDANDQPVEDPATTQGPPHQEQQ